MKNSKLILMVYVAAFVLLLYFSIQFADAVLAARAIDMADRMVLSLLPLSNLVGLLLASGITFFLWSGNAWWSGKEEKRKFRSELDKVIDELKKVAWPGKDETKITTISVFVFVFVMMGIFIVFDLVWSNLSKLI
ncbi:preprotein translocase subunit SecE [bacterium]|nr:preprotein translocase subunit SecE [bacterium]